MSLLSFPTGATAISAKTCMIDTHREAGILPASLDIHKAYRYNKKHQSKSLMGFPGRLVE